MSKRWNPTSIHSFISRMSFDVFRLGSGKNANLNSFCLQHWAVINLKCSFREITEFPYISMQWRLQWTPSRARSLKASYHCVNMFPVYMHRARPHCPKKPHQIATIKMKLYDTLITNIKRKFTKIFLRRFVTANRPSTFHSLKQFILMKITQQSWVEERISDGLDYMQRHIIKANKSVLLKCFL